MSIVGYLVCGLAATLGAVIMLCPHETLEQQVQLHQHLSWKLDVSNLQRELVRVKIAGAIMIVAALIGAYFTLHMRLFFERIIYVS